MGWAPEKRYYNRVQHVVVQPQGGSNGPDIPNTLAMDKYDSLQRKKKILCNIQQMNGKVKLDKSAPKATL